MLGRRIGTVWWGVREFVNFLDYIMLLFGHGAGRRVLLKTRDGIAILCRNNRWDVRIVTETFRDRPYLRGIGSMTETPVVVDIGGYIGDFSLYAAKRLGARVIVYEPVPENFSLIQENCRLNPWANMRVWNKAVASAPEISINVAREKDDVHASSHMYQNANEKITIKATRIDDLFTENAVSRIDLLKVDCEGCEYEILRDAAVSTLERIENVAMEYHCIDGWEAKLDSVCTRLRIAGFHVEQDRAECVLWARRAGDRPE